MVLSGRALAFTLLGWSLVKVLVRTLVTKPQPGLVKFHENYGADGLEPIAMEEREQLERFSGCIACGRCDMGEAERIAASAGEYPGLMQIVLASSRNMPDFDAAANALAHVPEEILREKEAICPARIPFRQLAAFVRAKAPVATPQLLPVGSPRALPIERAGVGST